MRPLRGVRETPHVSGGRLQNESTLPSRSGQEELRSQATLVFRIQNTITEPVGARAKATNSFSAERCVDCDLYGRGHIVPTALPLQPLELGEGALQPAGVQGLIFEDAVEGFRIRNGVTIMTVPPFPFTTQASTATPCPNPANEALGRARILKRSP